MAGRRIEWTLSQDAFDRFLQGLDPDRVAAGERYEHLHTALSRFFEWRGAAAAEECADEVIDRVSRKLQEGERIADLRSYCYGVARKVLLERSRETAREPIDPAVHAAMAAADDTGGELQLACLVQCMAALPRAERDLITEYHRELGTEKIRARKSLAQLLKLAPGTLRIQAHRIRLKLERCVTECLAREEGAKRSAGFPHTDRR